LGGAFVILKCVEYGEKIAKGHDITENAFFSFYWGLTGFHLLHVMIGICILLHFAGKVRSGAGFDEPDASLETGVAFWHLCDLIWVLLFPLIYLAR
jgi:nitric oxide reductase NorE protein